MKLIYLSNGGRGVEETQVLQYEMPSRATGRTTKLLEAAIAQAMAGKPVYFVTHQHHLRDLFRNSAIELFAKKHKDVPPEHWPIEFRLSADRKVEAYRNKDAKKRVTPLVGWVCFISREDAAARLRGMGLQEMNDTVVVEDHMTTAKRYEGIMGR